MTTEDRPALDAAADSDRPPWRSGEEMFTRTSALIDAALRAGWAAGHSRHRNLANREAATEPLRAELTGRWRELDDAIAMLQAALLAAAAERDALREEVAILCDEDHRKMLELERLREVLDFYADELHYDRLVGDALDAAAPVLVDGGQRARAALAPGEGAGRSDDAGE